MREKQQGDSGNAVGTCDYFSICECVTSLNIIHSKSVNFLDICNFTKFKGKCCILMFL